MQLFENQSERLVEAEIIKGDLKRMPLKKDGWKFNWRGVHNEKNAEIFILQLKNNDSSIEGILQLIDVEGMLMMKLIEVAPHNIGRAGKKYSFVAGCLIAFAGRRSFKLTNSYKGFLIFETKTKLRDWYIKNYGAEHAMNNRMFIGPEKGKLLIKKYLG